MKKIITLLLLALMISPTINAQTKKELKKLKKLGIEITVRDIDPKKKFVVYCDVLSESYSREVESVWNVELFSNGLDVGDYYYKKTVKDTENREMDIESSRIIRGDYYLKIVSPKKILISEVASNFKVVGTITSEKGGVYYWIDNDAVVKTVIKELINKIDK